MNRLVTLIAVTLSVIVAAPAFPRSIDRHQAIVSASDFQTVPVMANTRGFGGATFQSYVALFNPTTSNFVVDVKLFDSAGMKGENAIVLAAGELKTYPNFLETVFGFSGGGAVTFQSPESAGGTHNNRFIVTSEIWTGSGTRYGTTIPVLELAGSSSRAFSAGITSDSTMRTNVGCFDQSGLANRVKVTVFDKGSQQMIASMNLDLAPNGWRQTALNAMVADGYIAFEPAESAACYAVVVSNSTNDGRFISAAEYAP